LGLDGGGRFILAFFDRCAIRASLLPPPAALGVDALIAPNLSSPISGSYQNRPFSGSEKGRSLFNAFPRRGQRSGAAVVNDG